MELILGHNQFIGISHTSEERSIELQRKFYDAKIIYDVVEKAADLGFRNLVIEPHPQMLSFLEYYKKLNTFDMDFYLQVPNIQRYINKMNDKGLSGLFMEIAQTEGAQSFTSMALKGILNFAKKDYFAIAMSALRLEVTPFTDVSIKALLLHNVITDLLLSLQIQGAFSDFVNNVRDDIQLNPGFVTLNFELFKNSFEKWGFGEPLVMTPVNPKGYDMNPSKGHVESAIKSYKGEIMAMNILGGGAFSINEANDYLRSFNNIKFCVVGASSREHLRELMDVLSN